MRSRILAVMAAGAGVALGFAVAAIAAPDASPSPARPGERSYQLSDLVIVDHYVRDTVDGPDVLEGAVGVKYSAAWSAARPPGEAQCVIEVLDASNTVVGTSTFGLTANGAGPMPPVPVQVTGEAISARGYCGAGEQETIDPQAGYAFSNLRVVNDPSPRIVGSIAWKNSLYPGEQLCHAALRSSGATEVVDFTLYVPEGEGIVTLIPGDLVGSTVGQIECEPL